MGKPIVISVVGDTRELVNGLGKGESRLNKFGKVAKVGLAAIGGGLLAAGAVAFKFAQAAAEDQQSAALMARQFQKSAKATDAQVAATERWITKQGIAKGVADDQLRPALSTLITATHDVSKAQDQANLAMDISAAKNLDLVAVSKKLAKAQLTGNVKALAALGVQTKDASGHALTFAQVQSNLTKEFGGAAKTKANTFAGMIGRVKLQLSEAGESIGYKLLPPLTKATTWFISKGVPAIGRFGSALKQRLAPVFGAIKNAVVASLPFFARLGKQLVSLGQFVATKVAPALVTFGKQIARNLSPIVNALSKYVTQNLVPAFKMVLAKFEEAKPTLIRLAGFVLKVEATFFKLATTVLGKVLPPVIRFTGFVLSKAVPAIGAIISVIIRVVDRLVSFGTTMFNIGTKVANFASNVVTRIGSIPGKIGGIAKSIGSTLLKPFKDVYDFIVKIINKIKDIKVPDLNPFNNKGGGGGYYKGNVTLPPPSPKPRTNERRSAATPSAGPTASRVYQINVTVGPTTSPIEAGRAIVQAIKAFEDAGGRVPA